MHITLYKSVYSPTTPELQFEGDWEDFIDDLLQFSVADEKDRVALFNLWQLKTIEEGAEPGGYHPIDPNTGERDYDKFVILPKTIRRSKKNAIGLWGLVLDYDANKTIEQVELMLKDYEYVIYTTFNHSTVKDKFRIVMPFDRMMTKEEFTTKTEAIEARFPGVDRASFSVTQAIYFHSGRYPDLAYSRHNAGMFLEVDSFPDVTSCSDAVNYYDPTTNAVMDDDFKSRYKDLVLHSFSTIRNLRRGGGDSLIITSACKSLGCSFTEYQQLLTIISGLDSSLQSGQVQKALWRDAKNQPITKNKLNEVITKYDGTVIGKLSKPFKKATVADLERLRGKPADKSDSLTKVQELLSLIRERNNNV